MPSYVFPTSIELQEVEQELLPRLMEGRPIFSLLPITTHDSHILEWEQEDNFLGLQQLRGLNGAPQNVKRVGAKRYQLQPGVYGEFAHIDEQELTTRRQWGSFSAPIDISDVVRRIQDQLLLRRLDRIEQIGWTLLSSGTFSVANATGVIHTDTFNLQTHAGSDWSAVATATPLKDFRDMRILARAKGVNFGRAATAYINLKTMQYLLGNTNNVDLHGRRVGGGNSLNNLDEVNTILLGDDSPRIEVYDEGYLTDAGAFTPYIPDDKVIIVGRRTGGMPIGDYCMTRNAQNADLGPGPYTKVVDSVNDDVPRTITVHDGHNGGPRIVFPSAVVIMSV